jgi:PLP dependent protein
MIVSANLTEIRQQLPVHCKLVAVSKTHPPEVIMEAYEAGQRIFGENKVQELTAKAGTMPDDIEWHLIGHLQSNKVKQVAAFVTLIHAVDSLKLLQEINKQGARLNRVVACLLQVHIAKEETKFGFSETELLDMLSGGEVAHLPFVNVRGLMGMATLTEDRTQIRNEFKGLKSLFEKLKSQSLPEGFQMEELSMGMSNDYKIAIEEGSTMVRIGSAIFGQRNYNQ